MAHKTVISPPISRAVEQELRQLYLRRVAVEKLIRKLEEYSRSFEGPPLAKAGTFTSIRKLAS